jgi:hypothetical protein
VECICESFACSQVIITRFRNFLGIHYIKRRCNVKIVTVFKYVSYYCYAVHCCRLKPFWYSQSTSVHVFSLLEIFLADDFFVVLSNEILL